MRSPSGMSLRRAKYTNPRPVGPPPRLPQAHQRSHDRGNARGYLIPLRAVKEVPAHERGAHTDGHNRAWGYRSVVRDLHNGLNRGARQPRHSGACRSRVRRVRCRRGGCGDGLAATTRAEPSVKGNEAACGRAAKRGRFRIAAPLGAIGRLVNLEPCPGRAGVQKDLGYGEDDR